MALNARQATSLSLLAAACGVAAMLLFGLSPQFFRGPTPLRLKQPTQSASGDVFSAAREVVRLMNAASSEALRADGVAFPVALVGLACCRPGVLPPVLGLQSLPHEETVWVTDANGARHVIGATIARQPDGDLYLNGVTYRRRVVTEDGHNFGDIPGRVVPWKPTDEGEGPRGNGAEAVPGFQVFFEDGNQSSSSRHYGGSVSCVRRANMATDYVHPWELVASAVAGPQGMEQVARAAVAFLNWECFGWNIGAPVMFGSMEYKEVLGGSTGECKLPCQMEVRVCDWGYVPHLLHVEVGVNQAGAARVSGSGEPLLDLQVTRVQHLKQEAPGAVRACRPKPFRGGQGQGAGGGDEYSDEPTVFVD